MTLKSFFRKIESGQALTIDYEEEEQIKKKIDNINFDDPFYAKNAEGEDNSGNVIAGRAKSEKAVVVSNVVTEPELDTQYKRMEYQKKMIEKMSNIEIRSEEFKEIEEQENASIFERRDEKAISKYFRTRFIKNGSALDPIYLNKQMSLNIDAEHIIRDQCKETMDKENVLEHAVILEYFSFNSDDINNFKNDLYLPFSDTSLFEAVEITDDVQDPNIRIDDNKAL